MTANIVLLDAYNNAAFLAEYSAKHLPPLFIIAAVCLCLFSVILGQLNARINFRRLNFAMPIALSGLLLCLQILRFAGLRSFLFVQYVLLWVMVGLIVIIAWNYVRRGFDTRQLKRLMPLIGALSSTGAVVGGLATKAFIPIIGVDNLLLVPVSLLLVCVGFVLRGNAHLEDTPLPPTAKHTPFLKQATEGFHLIRYSPLMLRVTVLVALAMLCFIIADFHFKAELQARFDKEQIASFLGLFFALLNASTLIFQITIVPVLIRRFGLPGAFFARPAIMAVFGAAALIFSPFWFLAAIVFLDSLVRFAWYNVGSNLSYASLPTHLGDRVKITHDGMVRPLGTIFASSLLLVLPIWIGIQHLPWLLVIAGLFAAYLATQLNDHYRKALLRAINLHTYERDRDWQTIAIVDNQTLACLELELDSGEPERIDFALSLIAELSAHALTARVEHLLESPCAEVQHKAAITLATLEANIAIRALRRKLQRDDADPSLTALLLRLLAEQKDKAAAELALPLLNSPHSQVVIEASSLLFDAGNSHSLMRVTDKIGTLFGGDPSQKLLAAQIMGRIYSQQFEAKLLKLLRDPDLGVRQTAIAAAQHYLSGKILSKILALLETPDCAEQSEFVLSQGGAEVTRRICKQIAERQPELRTITRICRIFGSNPTPESIVILEQWLNHQSHITREEAIRALIRSHKVGHSISAKAVELFLRFELTLAIQFKILLSPEHNWDFILTRELDIRLHQTLDRIYLGLAFIYGGETISNIRTAILSGEKRLRANAQELLDTILKNPIHRLFLDLIEDLPHSLIYEKCCDLLHLDIMASCSLERLANNDRWLQAIINQCATTHPEITTEPEQKTIEPQRFLLATQLAQTNLFANMGIEQLYDMAALGHSQQFQAGEILFREGDAGHNYYVIIKGQIELLAGERSLVILSAGSGFGEIAALTGSPRAATARSVQDSECFMLMAKDLESLFAEEASTARSVINFMVKALKRVTDNESRLLRQQDG
jgi:HEAT repeat protein